MQFQRNHWVRLWGSLPGRPVLLMVCISPPLQGQDTAAFAAKMKSGFWPALRMNWRVWTPVQFININYIPVQVRPANMEPQGPSSSPRAQPSSRALGSSQVLDSSWGLSLCPELLPLLDLRRQSDMRAQAVSTLCPFIPGCAQVSRVGCPPPPHTSRASRIATQGSLTCRDIRAKPERGRGGLWVVRSRVSGREPVHWPLALGRQLRGHRPVGWRPCHCPLSSHPV